ncbi:MAG: TonB-dependent receptor [bacterium]|nr:TonB-dependent receptor [Gammaproteobacteria bacterium]HIL98867.1 TonB-dependent receptor [Pseudomonadales bacterium]
MFLRHIRGVAIVVVTLLLVSLPTTILGATDRQIEEIVVTAERKEATISDTSISITAFTGELLEEFGIRNQEDLQNLVPAAVIEPYDMAIRGVGRNFRSLGGDPGIATYLNGVYSEDFGIASTEGGLFDIERIEFLRGPQGTLYGRNAIGGAVNFINKLPTNEFSAEARTVIGSYNLVELYGVVSGPLIKDKLAARFVATSRERDGYIEDLSGNPDVNDYGDENYALSFRWTPTDNLEFNIRGNERSYSRRMGGADAAGILNLTQNESEGPRDNSTYAWGYRAVDPTNVCADAFTRTAPVATTGVIGGTGCMVSGRETFNFKNPVTGNNVVAQRVTSGYDNAPLGTTDSANYAYQTDLSRQRMIGTTDLDSDDLVTDTSGQQAEFFDHQAISLDATWDVSSSVTLKYIFGYTDYFYDRESDVDLTSNPLFDRTFYVSQETEYVSHELQLFWDPSERLSFTSGIFSYDAKITQRGDFYDYNCVDSNCPSRYAQDDPTGVVATFAPGKVDLFTASRFQDGITGPGICLTGGTIGAADQLDIYCFGEWLGDTGDNVPNGPSTIATDLEYQTRTERYAYAAYTQGVYEFNDQFSLTVGLRWALDNLDGYENVFYYSEGDIVPLGFDYTTGASGLAATNQALGFLATDGTILDPNRLLLAGIPASNSIHRDLEKDTEDMTWRFNLDWTPTEDTLVYVSATKGLRSGGFNLVFFSSNSTFDGEELIAYELGYKGTLLNGQLQVNSALYLYDYENVHTFANGASFAGGYTTNVIAVPEAQMYGVDVDATWLATDNLTLGIHGSYTHSEYTEDVFVIDPNDPAQPESLFDSNSNLINLKGNNMIRVPKYKAGAWAQYSWPLNSGGSLDFVANYSYIDRVYFSVFERKDQSAPAYTRLDLRASWNPSPTWLVAVFVNNVMDEIGLRQIEQYGATEVGGYRRTGASTDPRLVGMEVRFKM